MKSLPPEYCFEPTLALAGGTDGLHFVHRVLVESCQHLKETGRLFVEAGSSAGTVKKTWPNVPFTWLSSLSGESVVFTLTYEELETYKAHFSRSEEANRTN